MTLDGLFHLVKLFTFEFNEPMVAKAVHVADQEMEELCLFQEIVVDLL